MQPLTAGELLTVWERGIFGSSAERALLLLAAACPEESANELSQLSLGQRDGRLLALRAWQFGSHVACVVSCPACRERLELSFNTTEIQAAPVKRRGETLRMRRQEYDIRFRLPTSRDLLALRQAAGGQKALLERCVLTSRYKGEATAVADLPGTIVEAIAGRMVQADPQAEVKLALTCPNCQHKWPAVFDIVSFFWSEINAWAIHLLQEVHQLASAYGWREADILALSPWRRQMYLELIG
jgi:uncharacterized protein YbaR (Trm112 family)